LPPVQLHAKAVALRRILAYSVLAILVGLLLVLLPLVTLIGVEAKSHGVFSPVFSESEAVHGGSNSKQSEPSTSDVEGLALSFAIAVFAFMFLRRRRPQHERIPFGRLPYWF
jgi:hypothetical protein